MIFARSSTVPGLIEYVNVDPLVGALISGKLASLWELQSVYGIMDAYDMLEIMTVDTHNRLRAQEHGRKHNRN